MNNCIFMAEVVQDPQLRFTSENQTAIAEMWVEIAGLREEDPSFTLKVVGWGNLAQEINERYCVGHTVVIEGRLQMSSFEHQAGFKEKRAELTAQKVYLLGAEGSLESASAPTVSATTSATPAATTKKRTGKTDTPVAA